MRRMTVRLSRLDGLESRLLRRSGRLGVADSRIGRRDDRIVVRAADFARDVRGAIRDRVVVTRV